jgi:hypothetical protein
MAINMNKEQTRALAVRLDAETIQRIEVFAEHNGLVNEGGSLNISAALRILIASALGSSQEQITAQLWHSAKGVVMREVADTVFVALKEYRDHNLYK